MSRDYSIDVSDDINSLEPKALVRSLLPFRDHVRNSRVDIHTDNRTLKAALDNFGCKTSSVNDSVKEILEFSRQLNLVIDVHDVPSRDQTHLLERVQTLTVRCRKRPGIQWSADSVFNPPILWR